MKDVAAAAELCILLFTTSYLLHVSSGLQQLHSMPYDYSATTQAMSFPYLFITFIYRQKIRVLFTSSFFVCMFPFLFYKLKNTYEF